MEKKWQQVSFLSPEENTMSLVLRMLVQMPLFPLPAIAKANTDTNDPPPTVETQEVDMTSHNLQNPPPPPHTPTSSSSGVTQGDFSISSIAANDNTVADDGQLQPPGIHSSSSVLREGTKDMIMKRSDLIVEASSIMCFFQIDSSKFIRSLCHM